MSATGVRPYFLRPAGDVRPGDHLLDGVVEHVHIACRPPGRVDFTFQDGTVQSVPRDSETFVLTGEAF